MNDNDNSFIPGGASSAPVDASTFVSHLSRDDEVFQHPEPRPPVQMNHLPRGGDSRNYYSEYVASVGINNEQPPAAVAEEHHAAPHNQQGSNDDCNDMKQDEDDKVRLKRVNHKMERVLGDIKNNVKAVLKELVSMQQEFSAVKKDLLIIQEEEHMEAANLETVERAVGETVDAMQKATRAFAAGAESYDGKEDSNEAH